jgi:hypothetical protein
MPTTPAAIPPGLPTDADADAAPAINKHIQSGAPFVYIPAGQYRIGSSIRLRSGLRLHAHRGATLRLADGAMTRGDDHLLAGRASADAPLRDIEIHGGTWDANNLANRRGEDDTPDVYSGVLLAISHAHGVRLSDMTLVDSETYFTRLDAVTDASIYNIRFVVNHTRPNQDGIHLCGGCSNFHIDGLYANGPHTPNDDLLAVNADDATHRVECYGVTRGPITDLHVSRLRADDCHTFVRLLSATDGAPIERVRIHDIRGGFQQCLINADAARECRVPLFDSSDPQHARGVGMLRDVELTNCRVWKTIQSRTAYLRMLTRADGFIARDVDRVDALDACPEAPTVDMRYTPAMRFSFTGLTAEQIDHLQHDGPPPEVQLQHDNHHTLTATLADDPGHQSLLPAGGFKRFNQGPGTD